MAPGAPSTLVALLASSHPSKVPFYVAGGLLAGWAVVLALLGLSRPDFPGSKGRQRVVMGISVVFVLATVASAILTASKPAKEAEAGTKGGAAPGGAPPPPGGALLLAADPSGKLAYDKQSLQARPGKVTIDFANRSPVAHNVTIGQGSKAIAATKTITASSATVTANLKPGRYVFFCSVDAHRQGGMQGTLTVG